eukprot:s4890_g2.t1
MQSQSFAALFLLSQGALPTQAMRRARWHLALGLLLFSAARPAWLSLPLTRRGGLLLGAAVLSGPQGALAKEADAKDPSEELSQLIRFADDPAQSGWQIRLPRDWITVQKEAPGSGAKAQSLLFSGGPIAKSEIKILRVPVKSKSETMDFFLSPSPKMTKDQAAAALSRSYEKKPSTFRFKLLGKTSAEERDGSRYLRYGFSVARCEGSQIPDAAGEKACVRPGEKEATELTKMDTTARHWEVATTVTTESAGGAPYALWLVECSVPSESWKESSAQINAVMDSFAVGTKAQLEALDR